MGSISDGSGSAAGPGCARLAGMSAMRLYFTGDDTPDALLAADPNALLIGMMLDQQLP